MTLITEKIFQQALDLTIEDRLDLIDKLMQSTNLPIQPEIEELWKIEAERRCREIDEGGAKLVSGEEVFKKIHDTYTR